MPYLNLIYNIGFELCIKLRLNFYLKHLSLVSLRVCLCVFVYAHTLTLV